MATDYISNNNGLAWLARVSLCFDKLTKEFCLEDCTGHIKTTGVKTIKMLRIYLEDYASFPIIILTLGGKKTQMK